MVSMMRKSVGAMLLSSLAAPAMGLAQPAEQRRPSPQPLHVIPFQLYDGRLYVEASGPGFAGRTFLIDSGAQLTHVTSELAAEAGLETSGRIGINGTGLERVEGSYVAVSGLQVGGAPLAIGSAIAAPASMLFGPIVSGSGKSFDGVIGYDLFAAYVVEVDYERRQIRLHHPEGFDFPDAADVVPIRLLDRKPYVAAAFRLGGEASSAEFLIDTGAGGALGFNGDYVAAERLVERAAHTLPSTSRGIGGATPARLGRVESLTIGKTVLPEPLATFSLAQGRGVRADAAGRIGGALLRRFTIIFHYGAGAIGLVPNGNFGRLLETDMSGLSLVSRDSAILVHQVADDSPAWEAGMRGGDRLIAIDGLPAEGLSLEAIRAMLIGQGRTRLLRIERDGQMLSFPIALRRRI